VNPEISIVVPLFNEGPNVAPLAREILAALGGEARSQELILVDDASTDDTWQQIRLMQQEDRRVRAVRHLSRGGQSAALWTGFNASRGSIIATLDGDRQNDPADLPAMLARLESYDVVCGVRLRRQDNFVRRVSSKIARWARKAVLSVDFPDTGCNLRVFKRPVLESVLPFDGFHRFLPILADAGGARVLSLPVAHRPRMAGLTKYGVWNRLGRGICDLAMVKWYLKRRIKRISTVENPADAGGPATATRPG
jgi:glycosyltransferase involved in cell wall biosynthesis